MMVRPDRDHLLVWAGAVFAALVLAFNVFRLPFIWDDFDFLGRALSLHPKDLLPDPAVIFWRPLSREVYFWVLTHLLGGSPLAAHVLNLAIAAGIMAFLMAFVRTLAGNTAALLAGLLFACGAFLPLEISWASAAQDLLCALFVMAALYLLLRRRPLASALAMAAALLSKETAIAVFPAALALAVMRPERSRSEMVRAIGGYALVAIAWVVIHPWTRPLLTGSAPGAGTTDEYLSFHVRSLVPAMAHGAGIVLNIPWVERGPKWPGQLIIPAAIVTALLVVWLRKGTARPDGNRPHPGARLAMLVGALVLTGSVALTSLVLGNWQPHYACVPALGLSMIAGPALARAAVPVRIAVLVAFLWLGIGLRGNPFEPIYPSEPNFRVTAAALDRVEEGFKTLYPELPASNVYVSVQTRGPGSGGIYRHLFRFQPLRVWYRQPGIWVLDPNRRRPGPSDEYLFWIAPDLSVYEISLRDLRPRGPTQQIDLGQYQKTLRGYALGLAGAGDVERAVYIFANLPGNSPDIRAFDRRTAVALLYAANRDSDAERLAQGVPQFDANQSVEAVVALTVEPVAGLDLDRAAMRAFGLDPDDPVSLRALMRQHEARGYKLAAGRFASRLQAIAPSDLESAEVLRRVKVKPAQEITVPIPYDVPQ